MNGRSAYSTVHQLTSLTRRILAETRRGQIHTSPVRDGSSTMRSRNRSWKRKRLLNGRGLEVRCDRKLDQDGGAVSSVNVRCTDGALVGVRNASANCQPQPGPFGFCGHERLKNLSYHVLGDARS